MDKASVYPLFSEEPEGRFMLLFVDRNSMKRFYGSEREHVVITGEKALSYLVSGEGVVINPNERSCVKINADHVSEILSLKNLN